MNKEEIATTYEEYKKGAEQVAGLGRLGCYQGLDYLEKLLEKDKYYSEQLEDTIVFIEGYINRIEKENQKYKEVIDKIQNKFSSYKNTEWGLKSCEILKVFEDILKEVE